MGKQLHRVPGAIGARQNPVSDFGDKEPQVEATIASLRQHFETVRQHEVKRLRGRLGQLSSTQESAIESLTHGIIDQFLDAPVTILKAASDDHDSPAIIQTVHRIFNLEPLTGRRAEGALVTMCRPREKRT